MEKENFAETAKQNGKAIFGGILKKFIIKVFKIIAIIVIAIIIITACVKEIKMDDTKDLYDELNEEALLNLNVARISPRFAEVQENDVYTDVDTEEVVDNGPITIDDIETKLQEKIKILEEKGKLNTYIKRENLEKTLRAFIKAEYITQYPDLRSDDKIGTPTGDDEFQGCIQIERALSDGKTKRLTYVDNSTFETYISNNDTTATNHFTLDSSGNLIVVGWERITTNVESNEPDVENVKDKVEYRLIKNSINYKSMVEVYTLPFDLLWAFTVYGEDEKFSYNLAQLALDSKIIFTVQENFTIKTKNQVEEYDKQEKIRKEAAITVKIEGKSKTKQVRVETPPTTVSYKTETTITTELCSTNIDLTYADTWIAKYENQYSNTTPDATPEQPNEEEIEDTEYKLTSGKSLESDEDINKKLEEYKIELCGSEEEYRKKQEEGKISGKIGEIECRTYSRTINKKITNTLQITTKNRFVKGTPTVTEKIDKKAEEDNFVKIFNKSVKARNNIKSLSEWFFEALEKSSKTADMIDLIKYLFYVASNKDYGVTEYDFSIFGPSKFKPISGIYGDNIEVKVWFALINEGYSKEAAAGAMGNFWGESRFVTNNLEDSFEPILGHNNETYTNAVDDGSYTLEQFISDHINENCGAGYGLAQWTYYSRKEGLYLFAKSKEVSIADENMQIEYMLGELNPSGGAEGYAKYQLTNRKGYTVDGWLNAETPEAAAEAFCWIFENPGAYDAQRSVMAREYYEKYKDFEYGGFEKNTSSDERIIGTYTSNITGRTFTIFNQMKISTASYGLWSDCCNRAAQISLCSGYYDGNPTDLIDIVTSNAPRDNNVYNMTGLTYADQPSMKDSQNRLYTDKLKAQLLNGGYAIIYNKGHWMGYDGIGKSGTKWAGAAHWVAILGYREIEIDGTIQEQMFVSDPGWGNSGWWPIDEFNYNGSNTSRGIVDWVIFVNEK